MSAPVYALNLFDVSNRDEYMAYSRRSAKEVQAHGGQVVALGRFREAAAGSSRPLGGGVFISRVVFTALAGLRTAK